MKKPNHWNVLLSLASLLLAVGCSSGSMNGSTDESAPPADAGTDAVPPAAGADGAPPVDPGVAGIDPSAPPPSDAPPPTDPSMASQTAAELAALQQTNPDGSNAPPPPPMEGNPGDVPPPPMAPPADATPPVTPPVAAAPESTSPIMTPPDTSSSSMSSGNTHSYTVKNGETLMQIAFEQTGDLYKWRSIYEANKDKISDPNHVPPGTELQIEGSDVKITKRGKRYLIKSGDTLGTISTDVYGMKTKWKRIWKNNPELIKNPNRIFAGFHLYYTFTKKDAEEKENHGDTAPAPLASGPSGGSPDPVAGPSAPASGPDPVAGPRAPAGN